MASLPPSSLQDDTNTSEHDLQRSLTTSSMAAQQATSPQANELQSTSHNSGHSPMALRPAFPQPTAVDLQNPEEDQMNKIEAETVEAIDDVHAVVHRPTRSSLKRTRSPRDSEGRVTRIKRVAFAENLVTEINDNPTEGTDDATALYEISNDDDSMGTGAYDTDETEHKNTEMEKSQTQLHTQASATDVNDDSMEGEDIPDGDDSDDYPLTYDKRLADYQAEVGNMVRAELGQHLPRSSSHDSLMEIKSYLDQDSVTADGMTLLEIIRVLQKVARPRITMVQKTACGLDELKKESEDLGLPVDNDLDTQIEQAEEQVSTVRIFIEKLMEMEHDIENP